MRPGRSREWLHEIDMSQKLKVIHMCSVSSNQTSAHTRPLAHCSLGTKTQIGLYIFAIAFRPCPKLNWSEIFVSVHLPKWVIPVWNETVFVTASCNQAKGFVLGLLWTCFGLISSRFHKMTLLVAIFVLLLAICVHFKILEWDRRPFFRKKTHFEYYS